MDLQMTWNTEDLFPTPEAWDKAMEQLKGLIDELAARRGRFAGSVPPFDRIFSRNERAVS